MTRRISIVLFGAFFFTLRPVCAVATPLVINFTSSVLHATPMQTITFVASVTNTAFSPVSLNGDSLNIALPLVGSDAKFFANFPIEISPLTTIPATAIFDIWAPPGADFGLYSGDFTILGGRGLNTFDIVGSASFAVNVTPEPGTWLMAFICISWLMLRWHLHRNRAGQLLSRAARRRRFPTHSVIRAPANRD